jgi:hypothetical protein
MDPRGFPLSLQTTEEPYRYNRDAQEKRRARDSASERP